MSKRLLADLALAFASLIWGATFVLVKDGLADMSVLTFLAVRFALAAVLMAVIFWRYIRQMNARTLWSGVQIGLFMFGGYIFQTTGLQYTTPTKAAFITGMSVVLVPLILAIFTRRRITRWVWTGVAAAAIGLYFLTVPPGGLGALNKGDPIVFGCAVMFALQIIFIGRYVGKHSVGELAFLQVAATAVLSAVFLPIAAFAGWEQPRLVWGREAILAILITAIGSTVIGFSLQTWAQQYTSPSHAGIIFSLEPIFAAITSWLLAGERFGGRTLAGAALILAGILIAEMLGPAPAAADALEPIAGALD
jgi:drug/metabolite transporter (DMT)-like permease